MLKIKKWIATVLTMAMVVTIAPVHTAKAEDDGTVTYQTVTSATGLQSYIDADGAYTCQDVIENKGGKGALRKISVDEDGWIFIQSYATYQNDANTSYGKIRLYSNFAGTSQLAVANTGKLLVAYVQKGTYYYEAERWNGSFNVDMIVTAYVGFMPASNRLKVSKITYSADKSVATVKFAYNSEFFAGFLASTLRVIKKDVPYAELKNGTIWGTNNRENALEKNNFTATENGTYTARIATNDDYWVMCKFKISGLKTAAPATPKITSYKRGTKAVSGTAQANTKIFVSVNGKTYKATVGSNGKWKITASTKLKKGQTVKAYAKNAAGKSGKKKTVTVK